MTSSCRGQSAKIPGCNRRTTQPSQLTRGKSLHLDCSTLPINPSKVIFCLNYQRYLIGVKLQGGILVNGAHQ
jgi:hypothetical protein